MGPIWALTPSWNVIPSTAKLFCPVVLPANRIVLLPAPAWSTLGVRAMSAQVDRVLKGRSLMTIASFESSTRRLWWRPTRSRNSRPEFIADDEKGTAVLVKDESRYRKNHPL